MAQNLPGAICRALDLIGTPCALEVLEDLAQGRSPYLRDDDTAMITTAVDCLRDIGAIKSAPRLSESGAATVEITPQGRVLFERLVEIEEMAARHGVGDDRSVRSLRSQPGGRTLGIAGI
jgi:hypothetical protein